MFKIHYFLLIVLLNFSCNIDKYKSKNYNFTYSNMLIDSNLIVDSVILKTYLPYKIFLDSVLNKNISFSPKFIEKSRPESELSNLIADACYNFIKNKYKIDFCLLNFGGIRSSMPKGNITIRDIYEIMPFENKLVIVELSYDNFKFLLEYLNEINGQPISGLKININNNIISHNLSSNSSYKILTSDYLSSGGDNMFFLKDSISFINTQHKIRDVLIDYCTNYDTLEYKLDQRFHYE